MALSARDGVGRIAHAFELALIQLSASAAAIVVMSRLLPRSGGEAIAPATAELAASSALRRVAWA